MDSLDYWCHIPHRFHRLDGRKVCIKPGDRGLITVSDQQASISLSGGDRMHLSVHLFHPYASSVMNATICPIVWFEYVGVHQQPLGLYTAGHSTLDVRQGGGQGVLEHGDLFHAVSHSVKYCVTGIASPSLLPAAHLFRAERIYTWTIVANHPPY